MESLDGCTPTNGDKYDLLESPAAENKRLELPGVLPRCVMNGCTSLFEQHVSGFGWMSDDEPVDDSHARFCEELLRFCESRFRDPEAHLTACRSADDCGEVAFEAGAEDFDDDYGSVYSCTSSGSGSTAGYLVGSDCTSSSCVTRRPCNSTDDTIEFFLPQQTIILFDWDDTLCPSSVCLERHNLSVTGPKPEGTLLQDLSDFALTAKAVMMWAAKLSSKVVVVTNATEGWVGSSCRAWLPALSEEIEKAEVVSARSRWEPLGVVSPTGWKAREFEQLITRFYSWPDKPWQNIISVGDAPYEHDALRRVVTDGPPQFTSSCRMKSIKFKAKPSIQELQFQLEHLHGILETVANCDGSVDVTIPMDLCALATA